MNTKQLIVMWIAVLSVAALLLTYAMTAVFLLPRVLTTVGAILLVAGALIYSFSEHSKADNKRVTTVVGGAVLLVGTVVAGSVYIQERQAERERLNRLQQLQERVDRAVARDRLADPQYMGRLTRDSLKLTEVSTAATRSQKCGERSSQAREMSSCVRVSGSIRNHSGWSVSRIWLLVTIEDTLGNVLENGTAILKRKIAPGESERFAVTTTASADLEGSRMPRVAITRADFVPASER